MLLFFILFLISKRQTCLSNRRHKKTHPPIFATEMHQTTHNSKSNIERDNVYFVSKYFKNAVVNAVVEENFLEVGPQGYFSLDGRDFRLRCLGYVL